MQSANLTASACICRTWACVGWAPALDLGDVLGELDPHAAITVAAAGTIGGVAGMLIAYGVGHNAALAAVLFHQAIGLLVPLVGGAIAYAILRRRLGPVRRTAASDPAVPQTGARGKA